MAAVEVTITGVLYDKLNRTTQPVVLIGEASLTGVGVGGGPVIPPGQPPSDPVHIWGPPDPRPTPPIAFPPGWVGGVPPNRPPEPGGPPPDAGLKPPPSTGGWGYVGLPGYGWAYYPGAHEAGPKG